MKDILSDIVAHTHTLGNLPILKITGTADSTTIESAAVDRSVVLNAKCTTPVLEFTSVFGMTNLDKLSLLLKCPEYKDGAKLNVVTDTRNGATVPTGIHFENKTSDFNNDFRFMSTAVVNEKIKSAIFNQPAWEINFTPSAYAIEKLKMQSQVNSSEAIFTVKTEGDDLVFSFGDESTHAGKFVFQPNVGGKLKYTHAWPVAHVLSILNLSGAFTMKISDKGALLIIVNSGLATYNYILPAQSK